MDDLISRQAAIKAFLTELTKRERKNLLHTWSTVEVKYFVADMLEKLPSAQPERRKGRWINDVAYYDEEGCPCIVTRCDQCGKPGNGNYCSYCGAEMREKNDG